MGLRRRSNHLKSRNLSQIPWDCSINPLNPWQPLNHSIADHKTLIGKPHLMHGAECTWAVKRGVNPWVFREALTAASRAGATLILPTF